MKGNPPPEVLNLITSHPCTYPKHPNHFIQPYAFHSIAMPLGGVQPRQKASQEPRRRVRTGLVVFSRSCMT